MSRLSVAGPILAATISLLAWRRRSLSADGAIAAGVVGTVAIAAGWEWGVLLVAFFGTSTLLSTLGEGAKAARTAAVVTKGGERDAVQVLANGGVFAAAAALSLVVPSPFWRVIGGGALAAATADTWATEVGLLVGGRPRSIVTAQRVAPGMSGGVTPLGTLAGLGGAAFIALLTLVVGWPPRAAVAAVAGGLAGTTADSLLGATIQGRRWCPTCRAATERRVHACGATTTHAGGAAWVDNDGVNMASTAIGALVAAAVAALGTQ